MEFKRELPKRLVNLAKEIAALCTTRGGIILNFRDGSLSRPAEPEEVRNIILAAETPAVILDGWEDEPGAPEFAFNPASGWTNGQVLLTVSFRQKNETPVGRLRAFFRGRGLQMEPTKPMTRTASGTIR